MTWVAMVAEPQLKGRDSLTSSNKALIKSGQRLNELISGGQYLNLHGRNSKIVNRAFRSGYFNELGKQTVQTIF
jgi:F0F1-type ATP synthase alpha subunit